MILAACSCASTKSAISPGELPTLAKPDVELTRTETPTKLSPKPSGQLVTVDSGELEQLGNGYTEALGMIRNLNLRIRGWAKWAAEQAKIIGPGGGR